MKDMAPGVCNWPEVSYMIDDDDNYDVTSILSMIKQNK